MRGWGPYLKSGIAVGGRGSLKHRLSENPTLRGVLCSGKKILGERIIWAWYAKGGRDLVSIAGDEFGATKRKIRHGRRVDGEIKLLKETR